MRQLNVELWFLFRNNLITFSFFYNFWHPNGKKSNCFWIYICHARLQFDFIQYNNTTNVEMLQCKVAELQQYQLLIKGTIAIQTVNVTKRANRTKLATGIRNQIEVSNKWGAVHKWRRHFLGSLTPLGALSAYHQLLACPLVLQIDDVICEQQWTKNNHF